MASGGLIEFHRVFFSDSWSHTFQATRRGLKLGSKMCQFGTILDSFWESIWVQKAYTKLELRLCSYVYASVNRILYTIVYETRSGLRMPSGSHFKSILGLVVSHVGANFCRYVDWGSVPRGAGGRGRSPRDIQKDWWSKSRLAGQKQTGGA